MQTPPPVAEPPLDRSAGSPTPASPTPPARRADAPARRAAAWRPPADHGGNASLILGIIVLVIGVWFFATRTLGLDLPDLDWGQLWPVILIVLGGWIVYSSVGVIADWSQGDGSAMDRAWLADWRRRVAALYAEVRAMAATDPAIALAHWRAVRERLFREHPQSPVPLAARATFQALHFDHDPDLRFEVIVEPAPPPARGTFALELPSGGADTLASPRRPDRDPVRGGGPRRLSVFWMAGYAGGLFIPFRDATNGTETYGAGRYLVDAAKSADLGGDPGHGHARSSTSTSRSSRRAPSTRAGRARWPRPRTASTSRSGRETIA